MDYRGDFNAILNNSKKEGGRRKPKALMVDFDEIVDELSLVDLKTNNGWFTWVNNRECMTIVKERLDRFMILANEVTKFPFIETKVIRQSNSDHDINLLDAEGRKLKVGLRDPRVMFRYDSYWAKENEAKNIIKNVWYDDTKDIMDRIEKVGQDLKVWQYKKYKEMSSQIGKLKSKINSVIDNLRRLYNGNRLKSMRKKLGNLMDKEEKYWAQRSRVNWLKEGVRNTRKMNEKLLEEFKDEEIKRAFNQIDLRKAPCIDGLSGNFYNEH
ncbi:uncharacterized protein [Gossypium hirsutum]|uniref:Uncharacterized protein n=1 Tax=Gossypium hirsutum TaxID=3635 RepID=A0ABM2ZCV1_GOSHI|nr:uncharacterized protein LOC121211363 [Gossypium hirsutum]